MFESFYIDQGVDVAYTPEHYISVIIYFGIGFWLLYMVTTNGHRRKVSK
jgi:hypothetical protein